MNEIFWIIGDPPAPLAIVPCPFGGRGLESELLRMKRGGIETLVSMLERDEAIYLDLADEGAVAEKIGLQFLSFPIPDTEIPPDTAAFRRFVRGLADRLRGGERIGMHCRGSIGRSTVAAACTLIELGWSRRGPEGNCAGSRLSGSRHPRAERVDSPLQGDAMNAPTPPPKIDLSFPHRWQAESSPRGPSFCPPGASSIPTRPRKWNAARWRCLSGLPHGMGGPFLATCALGFRDPAVPTGLWSCPNPDEICAVSGGYAYLDRHRRAGALHHDRLPARARSSSHSSRKACCCSSATTPSWPGAATARPGNRKSSPSKASLLSSIEGGVFRGMGWDMMTDEETPFALHLRTGLRLP